MARRDIEEEMDMLNLSENIREAKNILRQVELKAEDLEAAIQALKKAKVIAQKQHKR
jgi:hypothetical protein